MCDEYEDERMRAFWRTLAEQKDLVVLPSETIEEPIMVVPTLGTEGNPTPRARAKPMTH